MRASPRRAAVDRLSGRGVGLDVVRERLRKLGGHAEIASSEAGIGTSFRLTVPVSLVSTRSLLVRTGGLTCAIPIERVDRTLRIETAQIRQVEGSAALSGRGAANRCGSGGSAR